MRGPALVAGALLGGALVAACFYDPFRDKCRQAIIGLGNELSNELSGLLHNVAGKDTQTKEDSENGNEGIKAVPAARCADGYAERA